MSTEQNKVLVCCDARDARELGELKDALGELGVKIVVVENDSSNDDCQQSADENLPELADLMDQVDICIVYVSDNATHSKSVEQQVMVALEKRKRIVGVWATESAEQKVPEVLSNLGDGMYKIDDESFRSILDRRNRVWKQPDGTDAPVRPIKHHRC